MTARPWRTVIFGVGRIGATYAEDEHMARWYRYASHAQVLAEHPAFEWGAAVDSNPELTSLVQRRWGVRRVASFLDNNIVAYDPEVAVLATPPDARLDLIERCASLKAVLVEKPLGWTAIESRAFVERCAERGILVQVNLWRRCDRLFRILAGGMLAEKIGVPQAIFGLYGNGLLNNGTHLVDFVRMLFGEIRSVRALDRGNGAARLPLPGDVDLSFTLDLVKGSNVSVHALDFSKYREVGLDIWGSIGRITLLNEGLTVTVCPRRVNRAIGGAFEIDSREAETLSPTVGDAIYELYDNVAGALSGQAPLLSPGTSAIVSAGVIDAIRHSAESDCSVVRLGQE